MAGIKVGPFYSPLLYDKEHDCPIVPPRHFDCTAYDDCLEIAGQNAWQSFDCLGCSFAPDNLSPELLFTSEIESDLFPQPIEKKEKRRKKQAEAQRRLREKRRNMRTALISKRNARITLVNEDGEE